jgi:NRPS condensation-like uncharacterized protein
MNKAWMKLDNAAKIYPLVESDFLTTVFRFRITLDITVNPEVLLTALNKVIRRFPYYKVTLKKGFFWFYLEKNENEFQVYEDNEIPCRRMIKTETSGYLFRVLYQKKTIAVEFNHIIADGSACLIFLNTLVAEYLRLEGIDVGINEWVKDLNAPVNDNEYEDSHSLLGKKYFKTHNKKIPDVKDVFHIKDHVISRDLYLVTNGICDSNELYHTAKKYNSSITEFLTALYLESLFEIQLEQVKKKRKHKPVSIQVPINMRRKLNSESMRNFSLFITPYLLPNSNYSFAEIIKIVAKYFAEKTELDNLLSLIVQNYKTERAIFVRILPLFLKSLVTPLIYKAVGADTYSGTLSNIGLIKLPTELEKHVKRLDFTLGPCPITKSLCAVVGYKDKIFISFGRNIKAASVERKFFRKMVQLGIKVTIEKYGGDRE